MKIKDAIGTVISHNAQIAIYEDEHNGFSRQVWRGMAWDIPEEFNEEEFKPISDYIPDTVVDSPIIIELKESKGRPLLKTNNKGYKNSKTSFVIEKIIDGKPHWQSETLGGWCFKPYFDVCDTCKWETIDEALDEIKRYPNDMKGAKVAVLNQIITIS